MKAQNEHSRLTEGSCTRNDWWRHGQLPGGRSRPRPCARHAWLWSQALEQHFSRCMCAGPGPMPSLLQGTGSDNTAHAHPQTQGSRDKLVSENVGTFVHSKLTPLSFGDSTVLSFCEIIVSTGWLSAAFNQETSFSSAKLWANDLGTDRKLCKNVKIKNI